MPYRRRYRPRRKPARKHRARRARRGGANNLAALARVNYARCSETTILSASPNGAVLNANTIYNTYTSLAAPGTARAALIARNYQEFRITKMVFRYKPLYDTYIPGVSGNVMQSAPQLYMYVNRDGDVSGDSTAMARMGINPISLAKDGNRQISWKPSVILQSETGNANIIKVSPWLNCNEANNITGAGFTPNAVKHYGLVWRADYLAPDGTRPTGIACFTAEVETFFEFRRPQHTTETGPGTESIALV